MNMGFFDNFTNDDRINEIENKLNINLHRKIMLITIPKSGTHMTQTIFETMGIHPVRVYPQKNEMGDYRHLTDEERRKTRPHDLKSITIQESLQKIKDKQLVHTHLIYDDTNCREVEEQCKNNNYCVFLLKRNLRDIVVSHANRYKENHNRFSTEPKQMMLEYINSPEVDMILCPVGEMYKWFIKPKYPVIPYEWTTNEESLTKVIQLLINHLGSGSGSSSSGGQEQITTFKELIKEALCKPNFTKSKRTYTWQEAWSPEIDNWFHKTGLYEINRILGYE